MYSKEDDGLSIRNSWAGFFVILNPAYESAVQWRFINRAIDEVEWGRCKGLLLICRNARGPPHVLIFFHPPLFSLVAILFSTTPVDGHGVLPAAAPLPAVHAAPRRGSVQGLPVRDAQCVANVPTENES